MIFALKNIFVAFGTVVTQAQRPRPQNQQVHVHQETRKWWVKNYSHQGSKAKVDGAASHFLIETFFWPTSMSLRSLTTISESPRTMRAL